MHHFFWYRLLQQNHWGDHFCYNAQHNASVHQSRRRAPDFQESCFRNPLYKASKMKTQGLHGTLISSLLTPKSKFEIYNLVPTSTPVIPEALMLSSSKSCCQGKLLILREGLVIAYRDGRAFTERGPLRTAPVILPPLKDLPGPRPRRALPRPPLPLSLFFLIISSRAISTEVAISFKTQPER
uniref:THO complex subunit 4D n=1 Tax=Rhizophora mucronata TaxID=61149 RepID=A0A2P2L0D8_RHIMU